jgi:hypothetical protein
MWGKITAHNPGTRGAHNPPLDAMQTLHPSLKLKTSPPSTGVTFCGLSVAGKVYGWLGVFSLAS